MSEKQAHIVYCHPEPRSFVAAMRDTVRAGLVGTGWEVTQTDLAASGFNAVASAADFEHRQRADHLVYSLEQRHAWSGKHLAGDIAAEVRNVLRADLLVLVFPIFWYSVPAQLKGWIDRVFLSGVFYGGRRVYDHAGMVGKRALVVASLGGRDHMFGRHALHGELNGMLRHLLQGTLGYVGFTVYEPFYAFHVPYVGDDDRKQMLERLHSEVSLIDKRAVIPMPSLEAFDDQFRPLATPDID